MKIGRPTEADIEAAIRLTSMLDAVEGGQYPPHFDCVVADTEDVPEFDVDDPSHLRAFYERIMSCAKAAPGGISRVIWGMDTLVRSDVIDPTTSTLELHPSLVRSPLTGAAEADKPAAS